MVNSIQEALNPNHQVLTDEQEEIIAIFSEVDAEMTSLDRLSVLIGEKIKESTRLN